MKIIVTGANGQLGKDLCKLLTTRGHIVIGTDIEDMDITDGSSVNSFIQKNAPDAVIHCAAYTATDKAEDEPALCRLVNYNGTLNIAKACGNMKIKMMYISTDYVFDGEGELPFSVEDRARPISVYGKTKYEGEIAVGDLVEGYFIVRTSWVFGVYGNNFIKTILRLAREGRELHVICDQVGSPTYTKDLSHLLVDMIESDKYGIYHASNEGYCSWYDIALEVLRASGMADVPIQAVGSDYFNYKIRRPKNSRLDKSKLDVNGFSRLPPWTDAVGRFITEIKEKGIEP